MCLQLNATFKCCRHLYLSLHHLPLRHPYRKSISNSVLTITALRLCPLRPHPLRTAQCNLVLALDRSLSIPTPPPGERPLPVEAAAAVAARDSLQGLRHPLRRPPPRLRPPRVKPMRQSCPQSLTACKSPVVHLHPLCPCRRSRRSISRRTLPCTRLPPSLEIITPSCHPLDLPVFLASLEAFLLTIALASDSRL